MCFLNIIILKHFYNFVNIFCYVDYERIFLLFTIIHLCFSHFALPCPFLSTFTAYKKPRQYALTYLRGNISQFLEKQLIGLFFLFHFPLQHKCLILEKKLFLLLLGNSFRQIQILQTAS